MSHELIQQLKEDDEEHAPAHNSDHKYFSIHEIILIRGCVVVSGTRKSGQFGLGPTVRGRHIAHGPQYVRAALLFIGLEAQQVQDCGINA